MISIDQHLWDEHPLLWLLSRHPFLANDHMAINLLQKYGKISDQIVEVDEIGRDEQRASVEWLTMTLGLEPHGMTESWNKGGAKPGKEVEPWREQS